MREMSVPRVFLTIAEATGHPPTFRRTRSVAATERGAVVIETAIRYDGPELRSRCGPVTWI
jgi:hypothetical protein